MGKDQIKQVKIHNKSDKPDNIIKKENDIYLECEELENQLPKYLRGYFAYLRGNVLPKTRLAYLHDVKFFFRYLIDETDLTQAETIDKIRLEELNQEVLSFLLRAFIPLRDASEAKAPAQQRKPDMSQMQTSRTDLVTNSGEQKSRMPVHVEKQVGRNDPCPCGSGKKFKSCHGKGL